ncbi:Arginase/deacetylase [Auricularia subglabra TFB-10046 SS5]|nr:Arginase/deacetylase [Auricularia subglabra TFB-10046 SS5]
MTSMFIATELSNPERTSYSTPYIQIIRNTLVQVEDYSVELARAFPNGDGDFMVDFDRVIEAENKRIANAVDLELPARLSSPTRAVTTWSRFTRDDVVDELNLFCKAMFSHTIGGPSGEAEPTCFTNRIAAYLAVPWYMYCGDATTKPIVGADHAHNAIRRIILGFALAAAPANAKAHTALDTEVHRQSSVLEDWTRGTIMATTNLALIGALDNGSKETRASTQNLSLTQKTATVTQSVRKPKFSQSWTEGDDNDHEDDDDGSDTDGEDWDGGRHHAQKARAADFCYVNDCVLSIITLRKLGRVLYLDFDLHFADAVAAAFPHRPGKDSNVLVLSLHHAVPGFYPAVPPGCSSTLLLLGGASASTFGRVWSDGIEEVCQAFQPDAVVVQCGTDGLAGDPCGVWNWSLSAGSEYGMGMGDVVSRVLCWRIPTLLLGGGGYNSPNTARAWAYLTSISLGRQALILDADPSFTLDVPAGNKPEDNLRGDHLDDVVAGMKSLAALISACTNP